MRATFPATAMALLSVLAGCGGSSVVGRWGDETRRDPCAERRVIEFAADGQIRERGRPEGTWRQSGPSVTVTVFDRDGDRRREATLILEGDRLTMPAQNGRPGGTLRRCPA